MPKLLLLLINLFCFSIWSNGQSVSCGNLLLPIPHFSGGVVDLPGQLLVVKNILHPIISSESAFEMRYIVSANGHEYTLVINCQDGRVNAAKYDAFVSNLNTIPKEVAAAYKNLGSFANDSSIVVLYKKEIINSPPGNFSWEQFFKLLIKNHLFDMPDEAFLDKLAAEDNPNAALTRSCCGNFCELKVGTKLRNFAILSYYGPTRRTAKYLNYRQNILKYINPFFD